MFLFLKLFFTNSNQDMVVDSPAMTGIFSDQSKYDFMTWGTNISDAEQKETCSLT